MSERFEKVIPGDKFDMADLFMLARTDQWRIVAASLYLRAGCCMPREAKERGISYGFCDAEGSQKSRADATHFGWSVQRDDIEQVGRPTRPRS